MTIVCPRESCKIRFEPVWGHLVCPYHSPCIAPGWVYDPSRCSHCTDFFNSRVIGARTSIELRAAKDELSKFLKKLRISAHKNNHSLRYSAFVMEVKLQGKPLSFFQSMTPLDVSKTLLPEHTLSETDSTKSQSSNPPPSVISGSSLGSVPLSETPSRRSGVSSSASRNLELQAELNKYKSLVQAHGLPLLGPDKPTTPRQPVEVVSVPARPLGQDVLTNIGLSSLPLSIPITVISCVSASSSVVTSSIFSAPSSIVSVASALPVDSISSLSGSAPIFSAPPNPSPIPFILPPGFTLVPSSNPSLSLSSAVPSSVPPPPGFSLPPPPGFLPPSAPASSAALSMPPPALPPPKASAAPSFPPSFSSVPTSSLAPFSHPAPPAPMIPVSSPPVSQPLPIPPPVFVPPSSPSPPSAPSSTPSALPAFQSADGSVSFSSSTVKDILSFVAALSSSSNVGSDSAFAKAVPQGGSVDVVQGGSSGQVGDVGTDSFGGGSSKFSMGRPISFDSSSANVADPGEGTSSFMGGFGARVEFQDSHGAENEVVEDCTDHDAWDVSVRKWGSWFPYEGKFSILYDGEIPRSVLELANGKVYPYANARFKKSKDEGDTEKYYVSFLMGGNVCKLKPGPWSNNKDRVAVFF